MYQVRIAIFLLAIRKPHARCSRFKELGQHIWGYGEGSTTVWVLAYHAYTVHPAQFCRLIELSVTVRVTANQMARVSSGGITGRLAQLSRPLYIQELLKGSQDVDTSITVRGITNKCSTLSVLS